MTIAIIFFVVWMICFDDNSIVSRIRNRNEIAELEQERDKYIEEIARSKRLLQELRGDNESVEKFAREQYLMKKANEDIYIVKTKKD